jgi:hypothetical protein
LLPVSAWTHEQIILTRSQRKINKKNVSVPTFQFVRTQQVENEWILMTFGIGEFY